MAANTIKRSSQNVCIAVFEFLPSFANVCSTLIRTVLVMWIEKKENGDKVELVWTLSCVIAT